MENKAYFEELSRVLKKHNIEHGPVENGHYYHDDYDGAKADFAVRSGLVQKGATSPMNNLQECIVVCRTHWTANMS